MPSQYSNRRSHDQGDGITIDTSAIRFGPKISATLFSDIAEDCARVVSQAGRDVNRGTQLRRFYDEIVRLQGKVGGSAEKFEAQQPFVQMLKAKVAYAKGRKKVDENYNKLLRDVVDRVTDPATLSQAKLFMEAFMAYYKLYDPENQKQR